MYNNTFMKLQMYISSLWLLFLIVFILNIDIPMCFGDDCEFVGVIVLAKMNIIPLISAALLLIGTLFTKVFNYSIAGSAKTYIKIKSIKNKSYEHLTFLTTYIIPLICFDLTEIRYAVILLILLSVIAVIYVKTDMYYANPTLAVLGFRLYEATVILRDGEEYEDIIFITRENINKESNIVYRKIDENIMIVKRRADA